MAEKANKTKKPSVFKRIAGFFKEVKVEVFRRITWPDKKQVINNTVVVLVTVLIVFALVAVLDFAFSETLKLALNKLPGLFTK